MVSCPLCRAAKTRELVRVDKKQYYACQNCELRFMGSEYFLNSQQEFEHYQHHENQINDPNYRQFLSQLSNPLLEKLSLDQTNTKNFGLDYGCGPGPALATMISESGHRVALYDPYFFDDKSVLQKKYDFIACTETVEHFHSPAQEFDQINEMLVPGGWLAIMTCFQTDDEKFTHWYYRRDPTHVSFYRKATFLWLANHYRWLSEFPCNNVVLFQNS